MNEPTWRKSSHSGPRQPNCVEVAQVPRAVLIRDSRHPHLGHLDFTPGEWHAFITDLRRTNP
jgi:hypothetical protein